MGSCVRGAGLGQTGQVWGSPGLPQRGEDQHYRLIVVFFANYRVALPPSLLAAWGRPLGQVDHLTALVPQ